MAKKSTTKLPSNQIDSVTKNLRISGYISGRGRVVGAEQANYVERITQSVMQEFRRKQSLKVG